VQHAHRHIVSLADSDAAGVVFTARAIEIAHRGFEAWLSSHGVPIADMLAGRLPAMPIVRVEADLHAPMRVGDAVEVRSSMVVCGERSVTMLHELMLGSRCAARITLVHACVGGDGGSVAVPDAVRRLADR
jgi:acyl-CoA thioesterase FadM